MDVPSIPAADAQGEEGQEEEEEHMEAASKSVKEEYDASYHQEEDRGPFEEYFINIDNVAEKKRLPYIMMMFKALGFNLEEIYPYSEILKDAYVFVSCGYLFWAAFYLQPHGSFLF
jgi:hypothetical protein